MPDTRRDAVERTSPLLDADAEALKAVYGEMELSANGEQEDEQREQKQWPRGYLGIEEQRKEELRMPLCNGRSLTVILSNLGLVQEQFKLDVVH